MNISQLCTLLCSDLAMNAASDRMTGILQNDPTRYTERFIAIRRTLSGLSLDEQAAIEELVKVCLHDVLSGVFGALDGNPFNNSCEDTGLRISVNGGARVEDVQEEFLIAAEMTGFLKR